MHVRPVRGSCPTRCTASLVSLLLLESHTKQVRRVGSQLVFLCSLNSPPSSGTAPLALLSDERNHLRRLGLDGRRAAIARRAHGLQIVLRVALRHARITLTQ